MSVVLRQKVNTYLALTFLSVLAFGSIQLIIAFSRSVDDDFEKITFSVRYADDLRAIDIEAH